MPVRILQNRNNTTCATLYLDFIYIIEIKGFEECIFRGTVRGGEWRRHIRGGGGELLNIIDLLEIKRMYLESSFSIWFYNVLKKAYKGNSCTLLVGI